MPATTEFQLAAPKSLFPQTWTLSIRYYYFGPRLAIRWPCDWLVVVIQSLSHCLTLCDHINCIPVLYYLPEFAQTHVHCVTDAIQPSHPLLLPCPPSLNLSQHLGLF